MAQAAHLHGVRRPARVALPSRASATTCSALVTFSPLVLRRADERVGVDARLEHAEAAAGRRTRGQRQEADLPGRSRCASAQLAAENESHAHAGPDRHEDEVVVLGAMSVGELGDSGEVDVVLQPQRRTTELVTQPVDGSAGLEPGQAWRELHVVAVRLDHTGAGERGRDDVLQRQPRLSSEILGDAADLVRQLAAASRGGAFVAAGPSPATDVGKHHAHPASADVDGEHMPARRIEVIEQRSGSAVAARAAHLAKQAGFLEAGQGQRDRRLGQARCARELGPGDGPFPEHDLEHAALVHRTEMGGATTCRGHDHLSVRELYE